MVDLVVLAQQREDKIETDLATSTKPSQPDSNTFLLEQTYAFLGVNRPCKSRFIC